MDKGLIHLDMIFPSHHQPSKVAPPCQGAFDFPSSLVATQRASILGGWFGSIFAMRTDQLNPPSCQPRPQRIGIGGFVVDQPGRIFPRSPATGARHGYPLQGRLDQPDFGWGRRVQVVSQRNTLAVCHHHPLRTLSAFGFTDTGPPFLAGAKLPSANVSAQSSWPCSSSWPNKARHAFSQMPCSSQRRSRRQQVLGRRVSCREVFPAGTTTQHPQNTLKHRPVGNRAWDRRWARLSARGATGLYAPIVRRLIRTDGETYNHSLSREKTSTSKKEKTKPTIKL